MQPKELVLALSDGKACSGSALAARFGVTRAAVWKRIEELRAAGLPVEGAAGQGYHLAAPVELLDPDRIRGAMSAHGRARLGVIDVHWEIDSTNSEWMRRAATLPDLSVCTAERQSAGRGRRGRAWQSPACSNVYLSLLRRFDAGMGALSGLSLVVGVAVAEAVRAVGASGVGLKWPNDVLADGAKLAGILVELGGEFLGPCHAVIGIGVNVQLPDAARASIDQPAIDLATVCRAVPSRNTVIAALLDRLVEDLDTFERDGFAAFQSRFEALDVLRDQALAVADPRGVQSGIGAGVDDRGALCLRQGATIVRFDSAEVTVRRT
ncbi:biotin--[acetyl-CoA-carboxylase] ligase [Tahibacter amnicola]|uniref:Bifunctional ligase/repressor BirA n=1 Tax=Tahibacter amnicola TaxID=2976241 RepID=A0ABY6BD67_9GAMM|nr:biotin--[acetyl-CoA-carboxylase] ligase [Tahibacter amnicola]UXI67799.1 biotin--[acetyl-CoA-carboxylase] ligase [Tahibacter amnicola]